MNLHATALIAEDEPLLAHTLQHALHTLWPELHIAAIASDGLSAVPLALQHRPEILFFDIRMPGQSGLDAAAELADAWPDALAFPLLVFVTAFDQYAIQAFAAQAVDYLLKPLRPDRLAHTVARLQNALALRRQQPARSADLDPVLDQLRALLHAPNGPTHPQLAPLQLLQASVGKQLRMVPVADVVRLEAADKYVRVFTHDGSEVLLRTPLKELLQRLDPQEFWQIHRGAAVRAAAIDTVSRDDAGRLSLSLKGQSERLGVSRLYAHQFKAM